MKRSPLSFRLLPLALAALVFISYGVYIPYFGFYGDDWIYIYNAHLLGAGSFRDFVAVDRPFSAWIYTLTTPVFGDTVIWYHLLLLGLRLGSVLLLWWVLCLVWPQNPRQTAWVAMLFAVYPGFLQQPIAVQFILHFTVLNLFFLSLGFMLLSLKYRRWYLPLTLLGAATSLGMFSLEYFVGLEFLRPVLIFLVLSRQAPPQARCWLSALGFWLPYLPSLIAFGVWRVVIFRFPTYQPDMAYDLLSNPAKTLPLLAGRVLGDLKTVIFDAWRQTLTFPAGFETQIHFVVLVLVVFLAALVYLNRLSSTKSTGTEAPKSFWERWLPQAFVMSLLAFLGAGLPFWATSIKVELPFPWDRSMLPFMVGACLLTVVLLELVIQPRIRPVVMAGLLASAVGFHYRNALVYEEEWQNLRTYFSQLVWRAPDLKPGTILVSDEIPLFRFSDNDLTPIVNWIYAPDHHSAQIPYKYFDLSTRMDAALPGLEENLPVEHNYRNHRFSSSTSGVLSIFYRQSGCLYVLGPEDSHFPGLPATIAETLPISHLEQIETGSGVEASLPPAFQGDAPRDWCFYFEKADLARQQQDWMTISNLATQAESLDLTEKNRYELLPFIEGFAHTGEVERFRQYVNLANEDEEIRPALCQRLNHIQTNSVTADVQTIIAEVGCSK
ncbi:MAG: hypothetical protein IT308_01375 [Anaerolineaceae bacterium]|nr:hypothetical protein [Anaerolineaceae bacterium]